jgi:ADP-ribosyl-[dinitrogen reductase] hydrolase
MTEKERQRIFEHLAATGEMPVRVEPFFAREPVDRPVDWARLEGMLLGLAIGDALGNPTEGMTPGERASQYGEIADYLPNRYVNGERKGTPTDDTQLAFWTVERLVNDSTLNLEAIARTFSSRRIFGIGSSVLEFVSNIRDGVPWHSAAPKSAGNGALMRIAPVLLLHNREPGTGLWRDAALLARLTHHDAASVMSCVAFVSLLWQLASLKDPPPGEWWIDSYLEALNELDPGPMYSPRGGAYLNTDTFSAAIAERLRDAQKRGWTTRTACNRFYSGAYLLETVPCAIYILSKHSHDPEAAIVRAVNDTKDNDTIAAVVGAAVGALHGVDALPERWRRHLTGRTRSDDNGFVFELLGQARLIYHLGISDAHELISDAELRAEQVPPPDAEWDEISRFALTTRGYERCGGPSECERIANSVRERLYDVPLADARIALFFEQRRWRHFGDAPQGNDLAFVAALVEHIRRLVKLRGL